MNKILNPEETYIFSKFFDLKIPAKSLAVEFGYSFERKRLDLSQYSGALDRVEQTRDHISEILPYVSLSIKSAKREWLADFGTGSPWRLGATKALFTTFPFCFDRSLFQHLCDKSSAIFDC